MKLILMVAKTCRQLVAIKHLDIILKWIPREKNIFGKTLERELRKRKKLNAKKKKRNKGKKEEDIIPL